MNSTELWDKLKKYITPTKKDNSYIIYLDKELLIKNKGIVQYLEKNEKGIYVHCTDTIKIKATNDHVWTTENKGDCHTDKLSINDEILVGENNAKPYKISKLENYKKHDFSYDVTTESAHFMANNAYSHNCRSWLSPIWEDVEYPEDTAFDWQLITSKNVQYDGAPNKNFNYSMPFVTKSLVTMAQENFKDIAINFNGNTGWPIKWNPGNKTIVIRQPKVYGRWNNGVVTINLPHVALEALDKVKTKYFGEDNEEGNVYDYIDEIKSVFYTILEKRLELCHKALQIRNDYARKIKAKNSPILWQYGALYRAPSGETTVGEIMDAHPTRCSISLGYVGLFETCQAVINKSNTTDEGRLFSKDVLQFINNTLNAWKENEHLGYSLYGTPEESLTYKFSLANQKDFGYIKYITDKDYIVNSYHVDPREEITWNDKLRIEGEYLALSSGGAVSYIETVDMTQNTQALEEVIAYMHDNIAYAEVNRKIGVCYECKYQGEIPLTKTENGTFVFTCPNCGNTKDDKLLVIVRLCGYIGQAAAGNTNRGRLDDIYHRWVHLGMEPSLQRRLIAKANQYKFKNIKMK